VALLAVWFVLMISCYAEDVSEKLPSPWGLGNTNRW
jgi:hypothetical protein